jgi:hypothetical protein
MSWRRRERVTVSGVVTDTSDKPIQGARVGVTLWEGQFGTGFGRPEITDAQGRYTIRDLRPDGRYSLNAVADGYGTGFGKVVLQPGPVSQAETIRLKAADRRIAGKVSDDKGKAAAGVKVQINGGETGHQTTTTDTEGRFSFNVVEGARPLIFLRGRDGNPFGTKEVRAGNEGVELVAPEP